MSFKGILLSLINMNKINIDVKKYEALEAKPAPMREYLTISKGVRINVDIKPTIDANVLI